MDILMILNRELKRVPLDFTWEINKIWCGYLLVPYDYCSKQPFSKSKWVEYVTDQIQRVEPPTGEGYQCWETVTEGSPISPVFKTLVELCEWLALNKSSRGITENFSKEDWKNALQDKSPIVDLRNKKLILSKKDEKK